MKILLVHNYYQQQSGEYTAVESHKSLLNQRGHTVLTYIRDNKEVDNYTIPQKTAFFGNALWSRNTYSEVRDLVNAERPDVAHVHNVFPLISPSVYRALKDAGVPVVQTVHNFRFLCPNGLFYTHGQICERCKHGNTLHSVRYKCYRESYLLSSLYALSIGMHRRLGTFNLIDRFIALTEFTAQKLVENGVADLQKITILGNFLRDPLPEPGLPEQRKPFVIFIGRLSREKGVDILIRAVADLPGLNLKILGDGPQTEALHEIANQRHISNVNFLGYMSGAEKWRLLGQALASVMPSVWYEHLPFSILESFATGTPALASRLGSLPSIVEEGFTGLLFRPGDSMDLRDKLAWISAHPDQALEMGRNGRLTVEERYSEDSHYERLVAIYQQLSGK